MKSFLRSTWTALMGVVAACSFLPSAAFAISYQPGQTLNPACPPTDNTCIVVPSTSGTTLNLTGSLTAYASSTIGDGTQAGGLTINGGATTTALCLKKDGCRSYWPSGTINILDYGAAASAADNQTALQNAINAAIASGKPLYIPSAASSCYKYTAPLTIDGNITITGDTAQENWNANLDIPQGTPRFTGSVLCPSSNGSDAIDITGPSRTINLSDFGISFQTAGVGTGNGIYYIPAAAGVNPGLAGSHWKNVKIIGQDGNHYGVALRNIYYNVFDHVITYMGGGFYIAGGATSYGHYGNSVFNESYAEVTVGGTANAYTLMASSSQSLNLLTFVRPQAITENITISGAVGPATPSQYLWYQDPNVQTTQLIHPDLETAVSSPILFGSAATGNKVDWEGMYTTAATTSAPAWGINGLLFNPPARTINDTTSTGAGSNTYLYNYPQMTITANSATTYPILATMFVKTPVASTNVTATRISAIASDGEIYTSSKLSADGNANVGGVYQQRSITVLNEDTANNLMGGFGAGQNITSGYQNAFYGYRAGYNATTSSQNTAVGYQALQGSSVDSSGLFNTAVGYQAIASTTSGGQNTAVGWRSLLLNTSGANNSAIGYEALKNNTTGAGNMAFGSDGCLNTTTGSNNLCLGSFSLIANVSGNDNVAVGTNALRNITGNSNTAIGSNVLYNETGANNVAVGYEAGRGTGSHYDTGSVCIGFWSCYSGTGANFNTMIGYQTGYYVTSGAANILIGGTIDAPSPTGSGQLNIGNVLYGTGMHNSFTVSSSPEMNGNLGVGTSTPSAKLAISANNRDTNQNIFLISSSTQNATTTIFTVTNTGSVTIVGPATTCTLGNGTSATNCSASDQRLKDNVVSLDASSSLAAVRQLNPVSFSWNSWMIGNGAPTSTQFGFIAQQVAPVFGNLVSEDAASHYFKLDYQGLFAPIVGSVQALANKIDSLFSTIASFADVFHTNKLCVGDTCVTPEQFKAMLAASAQSNASSTPSAPQNANAATSTPNTPPVIKISGNNPAIISVGDVYNDLGAIIAGPKADLNLGIKTFLNGRLVSSISVDTSTVATDTIDYVVTDQNGLSATSTRAVVIQIPTTTVSHADVATSTATSSTQ